MPAFTGNQNNSAEKQMQWHMSISGKQWARTQQECPRVLSIERSAPAICCSSMCVKEMCKCHSIHCNHNSHRNSIAIKPCCIKMQQQSRKLQTISQHILLRHLQPNTSCTGVNYVARDRNKTGDISSTQCFYCYKRLFFHVFNLWLFTFYKRKKNENLHYT